MVDTGTSEAKRKTWETYTSSWSETDAVGRLALFEQCLQADCVYTDPLVQATGYEPLAAYMVELHKNVPGVRFVTTDFQAHHDRSLTHWNMVNGEGQVLSQGASYGLYGAEGKLVQMTGFFAA